jgi:sialic acid synthase SpsE/mannose-6-phosphate isomerase-like protein (cupin superfamily)
MKQYLSKDPLFILEMANNHMGDVNHGLRIIQEMHDVTKDYWFKFGFKLQFRNLDTFIHPDYKGQTDLKFVKRFSETRLEPNDMRMLKDEMEKFGYLSICTPFDELSVDAVDEMDFNIIKIGSCSFTDWPLLERIVKSNKPIIASTAGSSLEEIDKVVSFMEHREKDFALMHCVGEYPTLPADLNLKQITLLRNRYSHVRIGFSTHEDPENMDAVKIAIGSGASIFEKHVGISTDSYKLNKYSANPEQVKRWLDSALLAYEMCGQESERMKFKQSELDNLNSLKRGVYARRTIRENERIVLPDVFYAIPVQDGQVTANEMSKYMEFYAKVDIPANSPILSKNTQKRNIRGRIGDIVESVKEILQKSNVPVPPKVELEISHHYGIENFGQYGLTMITIINRGYCKKMIIMLPGQHHPEQYHLKKEETFYIIWGDVWINLNGVESLNKTGDIVTIEVGVKHSFHTDQGVVFEEISTTHMVQDSVYTDPAITNNPYRKTLLTYWMDYRDK